MKEKLVEELKAEAKIAVTDLLKELCKQCKALKTEVNDEACTKCVFAEKERFIRAFLD